LSIDMSIEEHEQKMMQAFAEILEAEQAISSAEVIRDEALHKFNVTTSPARREST